MKQSLVLNDVKFYTKPILRLSLSFPSFPFVVLILSLFLDEILMPQDSPPIMHSPFASYAQVFCAGFLVSYFIVPEACANVGELL